MYPKQLDAFFYPLDHLGNPARYSLIEASTKAGKTVGALAWLYEQAYTTGQPGRNYWWVAPIFPQAAIAFTRLKLFLPVGEFEAHEGRMTIKLPNGATLWFKSADKPDGLYGEDVYAAVIDEASRCKEEAWYAVRSTLTATRGPIRMVGNVKGRKNWFYKLSRQAEAGSKNMSYHKITASDAVSAKVLAQDEIDDAKDKLPDAVYKELYEAEASDDGGNPFGLKAIAACVKAISHKPVVAWGVDLAKKHDWTVIIGLDSKGMIAKYERFQKPWPETIETISNTIGGSIPCFVDSTGVGDPIVDILQKNGHTNVEGYTFTAPSKQKLMEGLAVAVQKGETSILDNEHKLEMESFEYVYTRTGVQYSAPEGMHDDTVCAHALAIMKLLRGPDLAIWEKLGHRL